MGWWDKAKAKAKAKVHSFLEKDRVSGSRDGPLALSSEQAAIPSAPVPSSSEEDRGGLSRPSELYFCVFVWLAAPPSAV